MEERELAGNLFIQLIADFQNFVKEEGEGEIDERKKERNVILLHWLVTMLEEFGVEILQNLVHICFFIKTTLQSRNKNILTLSLAILSALLSGIFFSSQYSLIFKNCSTLLLRGG